MADAAVDVIVEDLWSIDRDVARAARALDRWRKDLADDPQAHAEENPFAQLRHVTAKSTWDALAQLEPSAADLPLRDALRRWVGVLLQARIGLVDELGWATAAASPTARYEGELPRSVSWREAWRGVAQARTSEEATLWLAAASDAAPVLAGINRRRLARRVEVARRMGAAHPWTLLLPHVAPSILVEAAARLLNATEELSREAREAAAPATRRTDAAAVVLSQAAAREASEGWPARLSPRWLMEAFGEGPRTIPIELPPLPKVVGAASFARALQALGFAAQAAALSPSAPFALAHDPALVAAHRLGCLFASLVADPEFHVRVLRLGRATATSHARTLARTILLEARLQAGRLLLGDEVAFAPADRFEEIGERLFGAPLDPRLRGAWPSPRDDQPARLMALLETCTLRHELRERFDCDWFRNPRFWTELREEGLAVDSAQSTVDSGPSRGEALPAKADALAHALEESLA
jgi:hypothetical protein